MSNAQLKPCPFCNGTNLSVDDISPRVWAVVCEDCDTIGPNPVAQDQERAVELWNKRPGERAAVHRVLDEALNSGDGVYRP